MLKYNNSDLKVSKSAKEHCDLATFFARNFFNIFIQQKMREVFV